MGKIASHCVTVWPLEPKVKARGQLDGNTGRPWKLGSGQLGREKITSDTVQWPRDARWVPAAVAAALVRPSPQLRLQRLGIHGKSSPCLASSARTLVRLHSDPSPLTQADTAQAGEQDPCFVALRYSYLLRCGYSHVD